MINIKCCPVVTKNTLKLSFKVVFFKVGAHEGELRGLRQLEAREEKNANINKIKSLIFTNQIRFLINILNYTLK